MHSREAQQDYRDNDRERLRETERDRDTERETVREVGVPNCVKA